MSPDDLATLYYLALLANTPGAQPQLLALALEYAPYTIPPALLAIGGVGAAVYVL